MHNYEITVVIKFKSEEEAKLVYLAMSPDMNLKSRGIESSICMEGDKVYLTIKSDSLSRLRGVVNSFFRAFRVVSGII